MTEGELELAVRRAHNLFDAWNDVTGALSKGGSWYFEALSCVTDAVHCGAQAATGDFKPLDGEAGEK